MGGFWKEPEEGGSARLTKRWEQGRAGRAQGSGTGLKTQACGWSALPVKHRMAEPDPPEEPFCSVTLDLDDGTVQGRRSPEGS